MAFVDRERRRPTRAEVAASWGREVPDVVGPDLRVLFCGINPSLYSAAVGHHFARPGNRFWPALHGAGLTDRLLAPHEDALMPGFGLGCTNLVPRATARADELAPDELRIGAARLRELVRRWRPERLAVLGVTAYRSAFECRLATIGPQEERIETAAVWVLPNPSGLNAHHQLPDLIAAYRRLRDMSAPMVILSIDGLEPNR